MTRTPPIRCTDMGNARRLVRRHGRNVRYCAARGGWFVWDDMRWAVDTTGVIQGLAKDTAESIFLEAANAKTDYTREELASWAIASQSERALKAMISLAQSEPGIPISPNELDANPYQLNVLNGTIDLCTGKRNNHRREDLISKLAPVVYNPKARDDVWEKVLDHATGGDAEYAAFLARAHGYCTSGDTSEEVLFFAYGPEATCKSTIAETVKATLGDYAVTADFESFIKRPASGGPRSDIARLAGSRFVCGIEVDDGKALAEGLIKTITGGDTVSARHLYKEAFEFRPTFKIWLAANHQPRVDPNDGAMWRRIRQLPFDNIIPKAERDPKIKAHLLTSPEARSAVLVWMLRGFLDWQKNGLKPPARVDKATDDYRASQDPFSEFVADCCVLDAEAWTSTTDLRREYESWLKECGSWFDLLDPKAFGGRLSALGVTREQSKVGSRQRGWRGIQLQSQADNIIEVDDNCTSGNANVDVDIMEHEEL